MVPCLLQWELVKGFLGEDISEVMVLGQHHVLEGLASLSLLHFLGQCQSMTLCIELCTFLMHCVLDSACYTTPHHPLHPCLHMCCLCLFVCLFTFVAGAHVACFVCLFPLLDWFH